MDKIKLGAKPYLFPMPVLLVGANVEGKPNFLAVSYAGIVGDTPPTITIDIARDHLTTKGIVANATFSVNLPSAAMLELTDYCGTYSGMEVDKSGLFKVFYGVLGNAPLITECPLNLECKVRQVVDGELFFGEIVESYSEKRFLTNGVLDIAKLNPIMFSISQDSYWRLGAFLGKAYDIGKGYGKKS